MAVNLIETEKDRRLEAVVQESEQLADAVVHLQEKYPGDSIAILVRTRTQLRTVIPALRARDLSWRANDIDRLADLPVIEDLLSLVRVILNPGDNFSWLCLLRAPWCGLASGDLLKLSQHSTGSSCGRASMITARLTISALKQRRPCHSSFLLCNSPYPAATNALYVSRLKLHGACFVVLTAVVMSLKSTAPGAFLHYSVSRKLLGARGYFCV